MKALLLADKMLGKLGFMGFYTQRNEQITLTISFPPKVFKTATSTTSRQSDQLMGVQSLIHKCFESTKIVVGRPQKLCPNISHQLLIKGFDPKQFQKVVPWKPHHHDGSYPSRRPEILNSRCVFCF